MATRTLTPVEEYLHTDYSPECDYVDGEVQERNLGEYDHATVQDALLAYFREHAGDWLIKARPELRLKISATRYRVPDVMVLKRDAPREQIVTYPPVLCIEVLSPEDRFSRVQQKVRDYLGLGAAVWVIDAENKTGYMGAPSTGELAAAPDRLTVPGTEITLDLSALLESLD